MKSNKLSNIPAEVWKVWAINYAGAPIGLELYNQCEAIIDKYPQYFEWEHKYKKIPKQVHEAYLDECYPDRHKPIDWSVDKDFKGYIPEILKHEPKEATPVTPQDIYDFFALAEKKHEKERQGQVRLKQIWNKHYKKYGLEYRK